MPPSGRTDATAGLPPEEWETQLEAAADDAGRLAALLERLKAEMERERTWLHHNPTPGGVFKALFRFFGGDDADLEQLGKTLRAGPCCGSNANRAGSATGCGPMPPSNARHWAT